MELNYENNKIKKIFINILLKKGLKINSEKILKNIIIHIKKNNNNKPNEILTNFINNLSPKIKIIELPKKKRKKKKKLYLFIFLNKNQQIKLSIKWLFLFFKYNLKLNFKNIINEIIQTSNNNSKIINFKKNYYKEIKKLKFFY